MPRGRGDARSAAVALLARRDWATCELAGKLRSQGYLPQEADAAISALVEAGLLDDGAYAARQVLSLAERGQGPLRIGERLRKLGLPDERVDAALAGGPDWAALAREVRRRRFGAEPPGTPAEVARQARFLQYRGFSSDHIRSATGAEPDLDWPLE